MARKDRSGYSVICRWMKPILSNDFSYECTHSKAHRFLNGFVYGFGDAPLRSPNEVKLCNPHCPVEVPSNYQSRELHRLYLVMSRPRGIKWGQRAEPREFG